MKTNMKQSIAAIVMASLMAIPFAFAEGEPENVNNVAVNPQDATTLEVTWDEALDSDSNPVDHYRIYYGTASVQGGDAPSYDVEVDTPDNTTSYSLSDLITDTAYYVSVTAIDGDDTESLEYSIEASGTPTEETAEEEGEAGDTIPPTVTNVIAADKNHVLVGFSEAVQLPELLAEAAFTITEQINQANILEVMSAALYEDDPEGKTVVLETADQIKNVNYIVTASVAIVDLAGNPISSGNSDSGLFLGSDLASSVVSGEEEAGEEAEEAMEEEVVSDAEELLEVTPTTETEEEEADTTPPEDITNFVLSFKEQLEKFVIIMNWTASINTAKDLVDQVLYSSMDRGVSYDDGVSLGAVSTNHQVPNLEGGKEYTFKITTKDAAGNESVGVVKSIRLPQTGLGAGFLVLGSALAAGRILRRKRRNKDTF